MKKFLINVTSISPTYSTCYFRDVNNLPSDTDTYQRKMDSEIKAKIPKPKIHHLNDLEANRKEKRIAIKKDVGKLSKKAQSRIRNACNWLLLFSCRKIVYSRKEQKQFSFYTNMITLTLSKPQMHSDRYIQEKMLVPFLKWLYRNGATMYVWKAEVQPGTNNIHFHIDINHFLHWKKIQTKWNWLQVKHGYVEVNKQGKPTVMPNSTDVKAIKNAKNLANEMAKYIAKATHPFIVKDEDAADIINRSHNQAHYYYNENTDFRFEKGKLIHRLRLLHCRIWACSESLSNIKIYFDETHPNFDQLMQNLHRLSEVKQLDHCALFIHDNIKYLHPFGELRDKLVALYNARKAIIPQQKLFTVESFKS